jgi:hypothetical protein
LRRIIFDFVKLNSHLKPDFSHSFIMLLLMSSMIPHSHAFTNCNSFPKIFGSGIKSTLFCDMDVFDDYLAIGC